MLILCQATDIYRHDCLDPQKTNDQGFVNCTGDDLDGGNCWKASHVGEKDCVSDEVYNIFFGDGNDVHWNQRKVNGICISSR